MNEREFSTGGRNFKLCKIDAFKQFHIVRRIGPILSDLLPAFKDAEKFAKPGSEVKLSHEEQLEAAARFAGPILNGLSRLSDADSELVMFGLLASVEIQQSAGNWARVATPSMLMVQDLELPMMMQLAGRAFMYNLSGFFAGLPQ